LSSGYYGGHPNPTRANKTNTFNSGNPQSPVPTANPVECDYRKSGSSASTALTTFPSSTNGITEYTASNFSNAMNGDLVAAGYVKNEIVRLQLNASGTDDTSNTALFSNVGSHPLDITSQADGGVFPGTIWVAAIGDDDVYVFEPNDFGGGGGGPVCSGADDPELDEDGDKYSNSDEIAAGTDPCSSETRLTIGTRTTSPTSPIPTTTTTGFPTPRTRSPSTSTTARQPNCRSITRGRTMLPTPVVSWASVSPG
jgi:hypothetical protein